MKLPFKVLLAFGLLAALIDPSEGSAEGGVPAKLTSATIATTKAGYQFEIKLDAEGGVAELTVTYGGKSIPVAKEEIPKLKEADLRQAYVTGWRGYHSTWGALDSVILVIPFQQEFRKDPEGGAEADEVRVSNVARLLFADGALARWEVAVSAGEKSGAWTLTCKDKGQAPEDDGKEDGLTNPYWSHNPINYSTPWSKEP